MSKLLMIVCVIASLLAFAGNFAECDTAECDKCVAEATLVKDQLSPQNIDEATREELKKCNKMPDPDDVKACTVRVMQLKDALYYLLGHTPLEFCRHYGVCESSRIISASSSSAMSNLLNDMKALKMIN